jgi:hypothetical protein
MPPVAAEIAVGGEPQQRLTERVAVKDVVEEVDPIEGVIASARDLAAAEGVRSIRVQPEQRPTYAQLLSYRARANDAHLLMMVLSDGTVVFWKGHSRPRGSDAARDDWRRTSGGGPG